jgi:hypothetical protein
VALGCDGVAGEHLDVSPEQLVDAGLPPEAQVVQAVAALGDVRAGRVDAPGHGLVRRQKAGEVRLQHEVTGGVLEQASSSAPCHFRGRRPVQQDHRDSSPAGRLLARASRAARVLGGSLVGLGSRGHVVLRPP